ncbi:MAG: Gfo/Idh/MocA family oxidoreductase [Gemmatales bacterium]|nr:Gfo/Idh/MocA family oxidoreductase [Gemmatales bacterium]MDW7994232.1 Gfo/Idh/MocA family oxidoreductase [Gemmatales bacterium]
MSKGVLSAKSSRRQFLQTSAAVTASFAIERFAHAAGSDRLKVGLVGCGGRGTGAASQALRADKNVQLFALADVFEDRLQKCLTQLQQDMEIADKINVPKERQFVGWDAYQKVIACCDVVLLCTPPHFRPIHARAAVEAGRHLFVEKPVAVDAPGVRSFLDTTEMARQKRLSLVAGLQLRYSYPHQEAVRRIQDGQIGPVVALQANDFRGPIWVVPRQPGWSDMYWQMRNWYYFVWLSGDFNVEQHVHMLDLASWVKGEYPVRAIGTGGRAVRTGPEYGNIYDHFAIIYEYADGTRLFAQCRQMPQCANDVAVYVTGTQGRGELRADRVLLRTGKDTWRYSGKPNVAVQTEHDELFQSVRKGEPINNGEYVAKSTLLAIMGRMAAYTGQVITWEMALTSKEDLTPPRYDWNVPLPVAPVAQPGKTKFV